MAQATKETNGKFKQTLLIVFVSVCCVLILLALWIALAESSRTTMSGEQYGVSLVASPPATATATATPNPRFTPTPTLAYWEIQE